MVFFWYNHFFASFYPRVSCRHSPTPQKFSCGCTPSSIYRAIEKETDMGTDNKTPVCSVVAPRQAPLYCPSPAIHLIPTTRQPFMHGISMPIPPVHWWTGLQHKLSIEWQICGAATDVVKMQRIENHTASLQRCLGLIQQPPPIGFAPKTTPPLAKRKVSVLFKAASGQ